MKRILLAAVVWFVGLMLSGAMIAAAGGTIPSLGSTGPGEQLLYGLLASLVLAVGVTFAATCCGSWMALSALLAVCIGVNTAIEAVVFSAVLTPRHGMLLALMAVLPAVAVGVIAGRREQMPALPKFGALGWTWRVAAAWLAFPVIYFVFGMMVAPFVMDTYNQGIAGLRIPPPLVTLGTQFVRSPLFLVAALPFVLWRRASWRVTGLRLGIALTLLVGIYGLVQATFFPVHLRVLHSLEIGADEVTYAMVIAWLFRPKSPVQG